jgi:integrase
MPKRSASGSGTIRQRKDGTWEARYTVGRDPGTGKQVQKSVYGKSEKEVAKKLRSATASIDTGTYMEPSRLTIAAWVDIWLAEYNKDVKPRTLALYTGQCNRHIKPSLGAVKLSALKPHDIQRFINQQGEPSEGKAALSPKSIKNLHGILHKVLQQAVDVGYIRVNPATSTKLPRVEKPDIKPFDSKQITAFLEVIKGHRYETLFLVDLFTGLRQSEIIGLTWDCIQGSTLYIYRQLQYINKEYRFTSLKNDKTRRITPAPSVMYKLHEYKRKQMEWQFKAGPAWCNDDNFIFTNEIGEHLAPHVVYGYFKRLAKSLGMPDARFHDLRHSYAVSALRAGINIKTVQSDLGHHSAAFTMDTYAAVTEEMQIEAAAQMDTFYKSVISS